MDGLRMRITIPIYMLHQVAPNPAPGADAGLYVTPESLLRLVQTLQHDGISLLTLSEAWVRIEQGQASPPAAVLTFDDVSGHFMAHALPVLQRAGVHATVFVISSMLKGGAPANHQGDPLPALTPSQVREIAEAGMEIGSHTATHRVLTSLSDADLQRELTESREELAAAAGTTAQSLCYPRGRMSPRVETAVQAAGYRCACTTLRGNRHARADQYHLARIRMHEARNWCSLWYTTTWLYDWWHAKRRRRESAVFAAEDDSSS